ncbi:hypothetical protein FACS1894113_5420 [Alphaproteobacteria bacterium]|nr:hypothetical protein FACS1894113_5420 [Alphaproteobacteria bacterium]
MKKKVILSVFVCSLSLVFNAKAEMLREIQIPFGLRNIYKNDTNYKAILLAKKAADKGSKVGMLDLARYLVSYEQAGNIRFSPSFCWFPDKDSVSSFVNCYTKNSECMEYAIMNKLLNRGISKNVLGCIFSRFSLSSPDFPLDFFKSYLSFFACLNFRITELQNGRSNAIKIACQKINDAFSEIPMLLADFKIGNEQCKQMRAWFYKYNNSILSSIFNENPFSFSDENKELAKEFLVLKKTLFEGLKSDYDEEKFTEKKEVILNSLDIVESFLALLDKK